MLRTASLLLGVALTLAVQNASVLAWSSPSSSPHRQQQPESRRSVLVGSAGALLTSLVALSSPALADTGAEVRGTKVTPFNSLIFQYRSNGDDNGLKASELNEPSVSYTDFVTKLKAGNVEYVEFLAPDGDAAYVTFKGEKSSVRIGEGYPIEQHDGWSSPAFAVRTVKNAGVPYKFVVPALAKR